MASFAPPLQPLTGVRLIESYLQRTDVPTSPPLPVYPSSESLLEVREGLDDHGDVVERLALALAAVATPEAVVHAPTLDPATAWNLYSHAVAVHLLAEDLLANSDSIISSVTDVATFQADRA
jgi:hypothetical protein